MEPMVCLYRFLWLCDTLRIAMLRSKLLSRNQRLKDCEIKDPAHVKLGDQGDHVQLIQEALFQIDKATIADAELKASLYDRSTAADACEQRPAAIHPIGFVPEGVPDDLLLPKQIKRRFHADQCHRVGCCI